MKRHFTMLGVTLSIAMVATPALAQIPDVQGTWQLDMTANVGQQEITCQYSGTVTLNQDGAQVGGPAELTLVEGPQGCPGELLGDLVGELSAGDGLVFISGSINGTDPTGTAGFSGQLSTVGVAANLLVATFLQNGQGGTFDVEGGPFDGTSGSWNASFLNAVPALTPLALTVLVVLLIVAGTLALRRRPEVATGP